MNADALIKKLAAAVKRIGPMDRTVYKRTVTRTGDSLTGRETVTKSDVAFNPQPAYAELGDRRAFLLSADGKRNYMPSDLMFIFTPDQLSVADIENGAVELVLKDASGVEEVFSYVGFGRPATQGKVVALFVYARGIGS